MGLALSLIAWAAIYAGGIAMAVRLKRSAHCGWRLGGGFLLLALAPFALFPVLGGLSAPLTYDGFCYGIPDGRMPCSMAAYTLLQADYAFLFSLFWNGVYAFAIAVIAATAWVMRLRAGGLP